MPRVALDCAVVTPHWARYRAEAAAGGAAAAKSYTSYKRRFEDTDAKCAAASVDFQPVVFAPFGRVSDEGRKTFKSLHPLVAANTNTPLAVVVCSTALFAFFGRPAESKSKGICETSGG